MDNLQKAISDAAQYMEGLQDPNPVVRIDVTLPIYDVIARTCHTKLEDYDYTGFFLLGIPIHIKDSLPTGCRVYRQDGTEEDIEVV